MQCFKYHGLILKQLLLRAYMIAHVTLLCAGVLELLMVSYKILKKRNTAC